MISETGDGVQRGFSLIEIIIVIALIALIGGLVVVNADAILRGLGDEPVDRVLQKAVREARFQAAFLKEPTELRYDEEEKAFVVWSAEGRRLDSFSTGAQAKSTSLDIEFEQILPEEGLSRNTVRETFPINAVTFRPDRSSTPFEVTIFDGPKRFSLRFDPFSDIIIHDSREH